MAEGQSNAAIAEALAVTHAAVEKHTQRIFAKLGLLPDDDTAHRRVQAVIRYLKRDGSNFRWWLRSPVWSTNMVRSSNHHSTVDPVERVVVVPGDDHLQGQGIRGLGDQVVGPRGAVPASSSTSIRALVVRCLVFGVPVSS